MPMMRPSPLRARRLLRGWLLRDLTVELGLLPTAATAVSMLERGHRPLTPFWLEKLAAVYATPPERLRAEMQRWVAAQHHPLVPDPSTLGAMLPKEKEE